MEADAAHGRNDGKAEFSARAEALNLWMQLHAYDRALQQANLMLQLAETKNDADGQALALLFRGNIRAAQNDFETAARDLESCIALGNRVKQPAVIAMGKANLAGLKFRSGQMSPDTVQLAREALKDLPQQPQLNQLRAVMLWLVGMDAYQRKDWQGALGFLEEADKVSVAGIEPWQRVAMLALSAQSAFQTGNRELTRKYLDETIAALSLLSNCSSRECKAGALMADGTVGQLYVSLNERGTAQKYLENVIAVSETMGSLNTMEKDLVTVSAEAIAVYHEENRNLPKAIAVRRKLIDRESAAGDSQQAAHSMALLGRDYQQESDDVQAKYWAEKAIPLLQSADTKFELAVAEQTLGFALEKEGQAQTAVDHYKRAVDLYRERNITGAQAITTLSLARTYRELHMDDQAYPAYQASLRLFQTTKDLIGQVRSLDSLSEIAQRKKQNTEALAFLQSARELSKKSGPELESEVLMETARYYDAVGEASKAGESRIQAFNVKWPMEVERVSSDPAVVTAAELAGRWRLPVMPLPVSILELNPDGSCTMGPLGELKGTYRTTGNVVTLDLPDRPAGWTGLQFLRQGRTLKVTNTGHVWRDLVSSGQGQPAADSFIGTWKSANLVRTADDIKNMFEDVIENAVYTFEKDRTFVIHFRSPFSGKYLVHGSTVALTCVVTPHNQPEIEELHYSMQQGIGLLRIGEGPTSLVKEPINQVSTSSAAAAWPQKIPQRVKIIEEGSTDSHPGGTVMGGVPGGLPGGALGGVIGSTAPNTANNLARAATPQRVRVSAGVSEGLLAHQVAPAYPPLARNARIQGAVVLQALIGKDGAVQTLKAVTGHPMLIPAAMDAVKQWKYKPYFLNGEPVELDTQIVVSFALAEQAGAK